MFKLVYKRIIPFAFNRANSGYILSKSNNGTLIPITRRYVNQLSTQTEKLVSKKYESPQFNTKIMNFLYSHKQSPIPTSEKNVVLTNCPHCYKVRKNSFAAHLNLEKGSYHCTTCKTKGSFSEFRRTLKKKVPSQLESEKFTITTPGSNLANSVNNNSTSISNSQLECTTALINDPVLLDQFQEKHKITKETLETYKVGIKQVQDTSCLTFPQTTLIYDDEFKINTMRLKMCSLEDPTQVVRLDPPTTGKERTSGLFGYQTASTTDDTIILTRRELDAMAAYQVTGIPSFSIPTSNYQLQESVLPLLERFNKIYLWMDDDVDGQVAAERFARKLGEHRCFLINNIRQGDQQGPLNAYDALLQNRDLKEIVAASAHGIKHDQIVDFRDVREEVYNEILHPEQTQGVQSKDLPTLNKLLKGHRPGELTIFTGPTGAGKTTIASQLSLDFCKSGVPTLWGSFEIMNRRLAKKMLFQFAGKDLSKTPEEFDQYADQFEQLPLYFLKFFSSTAIHDVLQACHHAVYSYDIRHIILDNLQFMLSQQAGNGLDKWDIQDNAIAEIRKFATQQDVHITLVVHPRKDNGTSDQLDIHSIFGSAKVTQEADNVIILQKERSGERRLDIKKNRYDGTLGTIRYVFNKDTHKIYESIDEGRQYRKDNDPRQSIKTVFYKNK
ncbi:P-loop containing nucleoside triphosphate hydrolase protein [Cokeromyces recurvatus]|uniref:P-loop containing nucleoside triphosphate hydrolase protein n=1 Tax=Cokeromyces recurvatus TaxID=90255 RepID=UPI00221F538A|nr:P-loop containing nucleoside triphosphate hydrolase protein [Cokeromyces recurvatus]KAI7908134.1 P-loop containing nucleoside triphosphate hydrolase protein [Cokeromyces recurvatus]